MMNEEENRKMIGISMVVKISKIIFTVAVLIFSISIACASVNNTSANETGTASKVGIDTDAAFVPYNNVLAKIHTGGGNLVDVDGYYSGGISSMVLKKSGCVSGHVIGD